MNSPSVYSEMIRIHSHRWHKFTKTNERAPRCTLADAQFFVARGHGVAGWPKFAKHLEALARASSPVSKFEAAVDAIVSGDAARLEPEGWQCASRWSAPVLVSSLMTSH